MTKHLTKMCLHLKHFRCTSWWIDDKELFIVLACLLEMKFSYKHINKCDVSNGRVKGSDLQLAPESAAPLIFTASY